MGERGLTVIVCGGRDFADEGRVFNGLETFENTYGPIKKLVHGGARGADALAAEWAKLSRVQAVSVPAAWKKHGKAAGSIRNQRMVNDHRPDFVIAFDGGKGTANMVSLAEAMAIPVIRL